MNNDVKVARELASVAKMLVAEQGDRIIAEAMGGTVIAISKALGRVENSNFLIVCDHGDWSGFMSLRAALQELGKLAERKPSKYFAVVER
jgi:hypothetical protein